MMIGRRSLNLTKNRFEENPILAYAIVLVFMIILIELLSYALVKHDEVNDVVVDRSNEISERYGFDFNMLLADNKALHDDFLLYHPYRWYELTKNFKGNYIQTDTEGFRNQTSSIVSADKPEIAFFGGSTAFSIYTLDDYTIPAFLSHELSPSFTVKNYGMLSYNSTAEMMTFIEVMRNNKNLKYAIFYDGVNEIGRHVEAYERKKLDGESYFKRIGHFHENLTRTGIENSFGYKILESKYKPNVLKVLDRYVFSTQVSSNSRRRFRGLSVSDDDKLYESLSNDIINTYISNVRAISAIAKEAGIIPIFLWQPDIYTTSKNLSKQELGYYNGYLGIRKLTKLVFKNIIGSESLNAFNFYNISDALDEMGNESHFYDYCHVDREANQVISNRILSIIQQDFIQ